MMGKSPATIAPQRGQSTVNGGRSCAVIMTKEDLRGLTPLIYSNVNPYGLIRLNMAERLRIERAEAV